MGSRLDFGPAPPKFHGMGINHTPGPSLRTTHDIFFPLKLLGVAALYVLLAMLALTYFSPNGLIGVFWPASGWALAVLLIGGRRYAWSVLAGAFLSNLLAGRPALAALGDGAGATVAALLGSWLLARNKRFDLNFRTMGDYRRLIFQAAIPASGVSALIGVTSLSAENFGQNLLHWWGGDALGVMLITPLILIWRHRPIEVMDRKRWAEVVLVVGLTALMGQVVFLEGFPDTLGQFTRRGYWMFLFVTWAAVRLGAHSVTAILCLTAMQVMAGIHQNTGFFANDLAESWLIDSWFYLTSLSLVGLSLAMYFEERKHADAKLRIAAIAFECQEGMIITDRNLVILRTNQSFTRIMGYTNEEVLGKTTAIMRSDRHPPAFYEAAWDTARRLGSWHAEVWHRRKNGEVFPQWLTSTAVKDEDGDITHFVVTHIDITGEKQQEAKRLAEEASHRDALVREVHHRIKNNLQGITGMMRQFAEEHPQTTEIINQAISQVRSIAMLHGLQGRTSMDSVRLCELTSAIAGDIQAVWQTPIVVDIPSIWTPGVISETEAVPIALVLNELIVNAVKHGGQAHGHVSVTLRKGPRPEVIQVCIRNSGRLRSNTDRPPEEHAGLQLVGSLMPRHGASLTREQHNNEVVTRLELEPPVVNLEARSLHEPA